ncbi:MAG TPA: hypothetical protein VFK59_00580 [Actinomycetota bacterium]|nr:hypothetical protein [Actinomycetota bacterium]
MHRLLPSLLALGLLAAACGSDDGGGSTGTTPPTGPTDATGDASGMVAVAASVDLYVGEPQRVAFGLVMPDGSLVSFGEVDVGFTYLGTAETPTEAPGPTAIAAFIPTYGTPPGTGGARVTSPDEARGVYQASGVLFDEPGFYAARLSAEVEEIGTQVAETTVQVLEAPQLPAPGDPALPTENLTLDSAGVPEAAIDSRFATDGEIPDPELHGTTIAAALQEGRPIVVVFATPVYCASRFCGPVTDMIQELAGTYGDRAEFIHVEIWEDFDTQTLNQAAIDWLQAPSGDLTEPWLFLIGADGTIVDRWCSLWSQAEVEAELRELPRTD